MLEKSKKDELIVIVPYESFDRSQYCVIDALPCLHCNSDGMYYDFEEEESYLCPHCNGNGEMWILDRISPTAQEAIQKIINAAQSEFEQ